MAMTADNLNETYVNSFYATSLFRLWIQRFLKFSIDPTCDFWVSCYQLITICKAANKTIRG